MGMPKIKIKWYDLTIVLKATNKEKCFPITLLNFCHIQVIPCSVVYKQTDKLYFSWCLQKIVNIHLVHISLRQ